MTLKLETIALIEGLAARAETNKFSFEAEHTAVHVEDLHTAVQAYKAMGWEMAKATQSLAFMKKKGDKVELVTGDTPEHVAFRVGEIEHVDRIESCIRIFDPKSERVEIVSTGNEPGILRHMMIKCVATGDHVQFIWRAKNL